MKRIFCIFSLCYILFSFLSLTLEYKYIFPILIALICIFASTSLVCLFSKSKKLIFPIVLTVFAISAVLLARFVHAPKMTDAKALDGIQAFASGEIISVSKTKNYITSIVRADVEGTSFSGNVTVITENNDFNVDVGGCIEFYGTFEFGNTSRHKGKESFLTVFPIYYKTSRSDSFFWNFVFDTRQKIRETSEDLPDSAMVKALILGDKSEISTEIQDDFKKLGTSHLLAISGLHLSIIVMSFYQFLTRLRSSLLLSAILSSLLALFYLTVSGFPLSLLRAAQMMIVFFFARCIRRENDSLTALFIAGFVLAVISPWSLFNLGFILSFLATLGILIFVFPTTEKYRKYLDDRVEEGARFTRRQNLLHAVTAELMSAALTSLAATALTMPVIMATFNEISSFFLIGNLIIVPIAKYYLIIACITVSLKALGITLVAYPFGFVGGALEKAFVALASLLSDFAGELLSLDRTYMTSGIVVICAFAITLFFLSKKVWALPVFVMAMILFIPVFNFASARLVYPTALIDTVNKPGANTALVRWRGKSYLLDQTASNSTRMYELGNVLVENDISYVDKAVFVFHGKAETGRIEMLLSCFDVGELVIIAPYDDFECPESDLWDKTDVEIIYDESYTVAEGIEAVIYEDVCTAFTVKNNENTFLSYRSYSEDDFVLDLLNADISKLSGKVSHIPAKSEIGTSFRLTE